MRESWTDKRLDDFAAHVDQRFDAVDRRLDGVERRVEDGFARVDSRFDALQRTMLQTNAVIIAALIGLIATQL